MKAIKHDPEWRNVPANDNTSLRGVTNRSGDDCRTAPQLQKETLRRGPALGRTIDIILLVAVVLWNALFLVLLFALI